jgi:hypothetical protein
MPGVDAVAAPSGTSPEQDRGALDELLGDLGALGVVDRVVDVGQRVAGLVALAAACSAPGPGRRWWDWATSRSVRLTRSPSRRPRPGRRSWSSRATTGPGRASLRRWCITHLSVGGGHQAGVGWMRRGPPHGAGRWCTAPCRGRGRRWRPRGTAGRTRRATGQPQRELHRSTVVSERSGEADPPALGLTGSVSGWASSPYSARCSSEQ